MVSGRLILDEEGRGAWNMAVDQALLETAETTGLATFRFYGWANPTLSLGYFQPYADRQQHASSLKCDAVRRASGGGAILHDREITYSLSIPSSNRWARRNSELYDIVHTEMIELLTTYDLDARLYGQTQGDDAQTDIDAKAFLCFQRRTDRDVVVGPHKVCGSAQRRLKNSVIQHGSLLLSKSEFAPELIGIENISQRSVDKLRFCRQLAKQISNKISISFAQAQLSEKEIETAKSIARKRFANADWTAKR